MSAALEVRSLEVTFSRRGRLFRPARPLRAVSDVSFSIPQGRTVGLVGESGCGKSTIGLAPLRLVQAQGGTVRMDGTDLLALGGPELRRARRHIQIIFQDPYSSLNPRLTAADLIAEPLRTLGIGTRTEQRVRAEQLLEQVGLSAEQAGLFPHQFSGGQRQRISIARALAPDPRILVCDEPVSALDVAIQAQILNLLSRIQQDRGFSMLFISHDLSVVRHISDDVIVMYLGRIVEKAPAETLFRQPRHPYTAALLSAIPSLDPDAKSSAGRLRLKGEIPSPVNLPSGCAFHTRCPSAGERCRMERPELRDVGGDTLAACHFAESLDLGQAIEPLPPEQRPLPT